MKNESDKLSCHDYKIHHHSSVNLKITRKGILIMHALQDTDPEIASLLHQELRRQQEGLEMIPSENFTSPAVLEALGSIATNKYSEGYPGMRYYGGNEYIDQIENLARDRAKALFNVSHANVQPYSGSPANQAVYFALCDPGDTVMGMSLPFGGHLTHGWKVNFSAVYYIAVQYPTDANGFLDYDQLETMAKEHRPKIIFCGATAYPRLYDYKRLGEIVHSVGAYFVADIAHEAGLIAAGVIPSPVGHADVITTTTHKTLRGPRGAIILCNGNPSDPLKPCEKKRENLPTMIDRAVFPGLQGGPHNHQTAAIAVALKEAATPEFKEYAIQIVKNAQTLAHVLSDGGLKLSTGGTDNHLILADVTPLGLTGKIAEHLLGSVGITVNKNMIPNDPRKPFDPSGIRLGTPALTTRGMKEKEMELVGELIVRVLKNVSNASILEQVKKEVKELTRAFPIYQALDHSSSTPSVA